MTEIANPKITDADLQALLTQNPLAAEQLRRIIAERHRDESRSESAELRFELGRLNGNKEEAVVAATSDNNSSDSQ